MLHVAETQAASAWLMNALLVSVAPPVIRPNRSAPGLTAVWTIHLSPPAMASSVPSGRAHRVGGRDGFLEFISFGRAPLCVMMINTANPPARFVLGISIAELIHWSFRRGFGDIVQQNAEFIWGSGGQLHQQAVVLDHLYYFLSQTNPLLKDHVGGRLQGKIPQVFFLFFVFFTWETNSC